MASSAAAGAAAQNFTVPANPSAMPAQASRPGLARRPRLNAALAAIRQHTFIHGSSSTVRAVNTPSG